MKIKQRLQALSAIALAVGGREGLNAQILYQNYDPDIFVDGDDWGGDNALIDVNLDGFDDMEVFAHIWDPCMYCLADYHVDLSYIDEIRVGGHLVSSFTVEGCWFTYTVDSQYIVNMVPEGSEIPGTQDFEHDPSIIAFNNNDNFYDCWSLGGYTIFPVLPEGYIPIEVNQFGAVYYGWVRLSATTFATASVMEVALNLIPDAPLEAGVIPDSLLLTPATNLLAEHITETGSIADYRLTATKSEGEDYIERYRLFIIPSAFADEIDSETLDSQPDDHSIIWEPNGESIDTIPLSDMTDATGEALVPGDSYALVILHEVKYSPYRFLSEVSEPFVFDNTVAAPVAVNDSVACNETFPPDIFVEWNKADEEVGIGAYRVYLMPDTSSSGTALPDPETLLSLPAIHYTEQTATDSASYFVNLPSSQLDINGSPLQIDTLYRALVMSIPEPDYASASYSLSDTFRIGITTGPALDVNATDIGSSGTISDIYYSFIHGSPEEFTTNYRLFLTELGEDPPDSSYVLDPLPFTYTTRSISGSSSSGYLASGTTTWNGEEVVSGQYYYLTIASVHEDSACLATGMSFSAPFQFLNPVPVTEIDTVEIVNDAGTPADLLVTFTHTPFDTLVSEYRLLLSPYTSVSLPEALGIGPESYVPVSPSGEISTTTLTNELLDYYGEVTEPESPYYVYLLSVGIGDYDPSISSPYGPVSYQPGLAKDVTLSDLMIDNTPSDIQVFFTPREYEATVEEYRVYILVPEDTSGLSASYLAGLPGEFYISIPPGAPEIVISCPDDLLTLSGTTVQLDQPYIATVMAFDPGQSNQYLSAYSNTLSISVASGIPETDLQPGQLQGYSSYALLQLDSPIENDKLELLDILGRSYPLLSEDGYQYKVVFNDYAPGMYFIRLFRNNKMFVWQLLVY